MTTTYRLPCGCLVERRTDHLVACCALHEREWQQTHAASVAERQQARQREAGIA